MHDEMIGHVVEALATAHGQGAKLKTIIFCLTLFLSSNVYGFEMEKSVQKDITYDGKPEKVVYKVWGENWESPDFSLEIYDDDVIIFQQKSTSAYWENAAHFNAWHECEDIAKCKEEKYGPDRIFSWWFEDIKASEVRYDFMLENFSNSAPDWYQRKNGVSKLQAEEYTKRLHEFLKGKQIVCFISSTGVYRGLVTYDKFLKTFVTFYTP